MMNVHLTDERQGLMLEPQAPCRALITGRYGALPGYAWFAIKRYGAKPNQLSQSCLMAVTAKTAGSPLAYTFVKHRNKQARDLV